MLVLGGLAFIQETTVDSLGYNLAMEMMKLSFPAAESDGFGSSETGRGITILLFL